MFLYTDDLFHVMNRMNNINKLQGAYTINLASINLSNYRVQSLKVFKLSMMQLLAYYVFLNTVTAIFTGGVLQIILLHSTASRAQRFFFQESKFIP